VIRSGVVMRMIWICSLMDHDLTHHTSAPSLQYVHLAREASGVYGGCIFTTVFISFICFFHERTKMAGTATGWRFVFNLLCLFACSSNSLVEFRGWGLGLLWDENLAFSHSLLAASCIIQLCIFATAVYLCVLFLHLHCGGGLLTWCGGD
jgi:hypothetical protein